MNEQKEVQISTEMRQAVANLLHSTGDGRSLEQVVQAALKAWLLATTVANPKAAAAATCGYQWKSLFLPEGCLLRIAHRGQYAVAIVRGDDIIFQGRPYSPRQFVMHVTGQVRNAWLALWIRSPGDARWHLADTRRRILRRVPAQRVPPSATSAESPLPESESESESESVPSRLAPTSPFRSQFVLQVHRRQAYLRRDDCVLDEQADLSIRLPLGRGLGPYGAGRSGPRDRRILGILSSPGLSTAST
jgi:hypothetical protein